MTSVSLTSGAIEMIWEGLGDNLQPVVQILETQPLNTQMSSGERYQLTLSDGIHHQRGLLAVEMNWIVKSGQLQKGSVVKLTNFACKTFTKGRMVFVNSLQVMTEKADLVGVTMGYDAIRPLPENHPGQTSGLNQPGFSVDNVHTHGSSRSSDSDNGKHPPDAPLFSRRGSAVNNQSYGGLFTGGCISLRNTSNSNSLPTKAVSTSGMGSNQISNLQLNRFSVSSGGGFQPPGSTSGPPAHSAYEQPPLYTNRGPVVQNEAPVRIIPIVALNPYQGKWTIKARLMAKGDIRQYSNAKYAGKVFSFDLLDSDGGEIRATCFNDVADQFYDQIQRGGIYLISKGSLKPAQKAFNHLNNDYEIVLDSTSTIQPCSDTDNSIPRHKFIFRAISEIESLEDNTMVDLIGLVTLINPTGMIMRKNGTETHKRTLQLKDMSGKSIEISLWGSFCNTDGQEIHGLCDSGMFPILAIKAGRVSDFNGKSINTVISTQLSIDPDIPEAHQIREWFHREGKNCTTFSISRETVMAGKRDVRKMVSHIKDEGLGRSEKPDWITVKATVSFMKVDNFFYRACPLPVGDRQCGKKVNNNGDGTWHCDRCDQSFSECDYRYILQFQIQDHTGLNWITAFQECGEQILGVSAKELYFLKYEEQDELKFTEVVRRVIFSQYLFKLKVKEETFSDEQRVKSIAVNAERVNPSSESRFLLRAIERNSGEDAIMVPVMNNSGYSHSKFNSNGRSMHVMPGSFGSLDKHRIGPSNQVNHYDNKKQSLEVMFCNKCSKSGHKFHNCPWSNNNKEQPTVNDFTKYGSGTNCHSNQVNQYDSYSSYSTRSVEVPLCNKCSMSGHNFQNCPKSINWEGQSTGSGFTNHGNGFTDQTSVARMDGGNSSNVQYNCNQPGHWARDCPGKNSGFGGRNTSLSTGGAPSSGSYGKQ